MTINTQIPEVLELTVGSAGGAAWGLRLNQSRLVYLNVPYSSNEILTWDRHDQAPDGADQEEIQVEPSQWAEFLEGLEKLGVFQWQDHYDDGGSNTTYWIFKLKAGDRQVTTGGVGSWPGGANPGYSVEFKQFLSLVRSLIGQRDFGHF